MLALQLAWKGGMGMRRVFCLLVCAACLVVPVRAEEPAPYVALTFDDGPSGRFTRQLLDGLDQRGVRATFFLCGYRIRQYPQETQRMIQSGHEIGCHGFSHKNMQRMSRRDIAAEIADMQTLLPQNCPIRFLRPPGGCCSENVRQVAEARGLGILSWSVDPRDWATDDESSIEKAVLNKVNDGDVILMHDMSESSVHAALAIVDDLLARGYRFVTATELAAMRGVRITPGKTFCSFPRKAAATFSPARRSPAG